MDCTLETSLTKPKKRRQLHGLLKQHKIFTASMQRLGFQVAGKSDWKLTNSSENKQIKTTGNRKLYKPSVALEEGAQTTRSSSSSAVAVVEEVGPQKPAAAEE